MFANKFESSLSMLFRVFKLKMKYNFQILVVCESRYTCMYTIAIYCDKTLEHAESKLVNKIQLKKIKLFNLFFAPTKVVIFIPPTICTYTIHFMILHTNIYSC